MADHMRGRGLVSERIAQIPDILADQLSRPLPDLPSDVAERGIVTTGIGSSEAAARYAQQMFSAKGVPAVFSPVASFYTGKLSVPSASYLMVFSQGLSPNAEIVLRKRDRFAGLIFVTSSTVDGQRAAGKPDRAAWLERLMEEGAFLAVHPVENEYEILPRFIGPVCVMAEVGRMLQSVFPDALPELHSIPDVFRSPEFLALPIAPGMGFFFTNATLEYAQNLSCKVLETLMIPAPFLSDALTYAHGPFQQNRLRPAPNLLFTSDDPLEQELMARLLPLFEKTGPVGVVHSTLEAPLAIFAYEAAVNRMVERACLKSDVDLVDWPGKGEDGLGYELRGPLGH